MCHPDGSISNNPGIFGAACARENERVLRAMSYAPNFESALASPPAATVGGDGRGDSTKQTAWTGHAAL